jgi:hypothetical protein
LLGFQPALPPFVSFVVKERKLSAHGLMPGRLDIFQPLFFSSGRETVGVVFAQHIFHRGFQVGRILAFLDNRRRMFSVQLIELVRKKRMDHNRQVGCSLLQALEQAPPSREGYFKVHNHEMRRIITLDHEQQFLPILGHADAIPFRHEFPPQELAHMTIAVSYDQYELISHSTHPRCLFLPRKGNGRANTRDEHQFAQLSKNTDSSLRSAAGGSDGQVEYLSVFFTDCKGMFSRCTDFFGENPPVFPLQVDYSPFDW